MSYILSALKKAEQDRHGGEVPDLMTPRAVEEPARLVTERKPYLVGGVAVLLLLSLWLVSTLRSGDDTVAVMPREAPPIVIEPAAPALSEAIESAVPTLSNDTVAVASDFDTAPAVVEPAAPAPFDDFADDEPGFDAPSAVEHWTGRIPDIAELPPSLRRRLPRLELTGHLYSLAHPNARKVILNGVAAREEQYLDDDLRISEITPDGVILDFRGQLFRMNADQMFR